jgi:uncharacterized repeat protein (TIGR01451 family)
MSGKVIEKITKNQSFLHIFLFTFLFIPLAYSGTLDLPQTGQTTSYETGDDGDIQAGVPWPSPRFTIVYCQTLGECPSQDSDCDGSSSNDVMLDNLTGLMWTRDGNRPLASKQWPAAVDYVVAMNSGIGLCGHTDWHLANVNELESLTNVEQTNLATWLNGQGFVNVQSNWYWSSTRSTSTSAWIVRMSNNGMGSTSKGGWWYVFPVRESSTVSTAPAPVPKTGQTTSDRTGDDGDVQAGIAWPSPRFTITYCGSTGPCASQVSDCDSNASTDIVTDNLTSLDWSRNANLFVSALPWMQAVSNGYTLTLCGETDWRLPNRKEIHSLTDASETNPALQSGHPFINVQGETNQYYWSSTTYSNTTSLAWHYYMYWGVFYDRTKTAPHYIWPVRGGPVFTQSDLSVTKGDDPDPVLEGGDITYTIEITNNGPDTATDVTLTDTLPPEATYVSAGSTQGTCSESGGTVTCTIGDMNNAATVTVTIVVTAPDTQGIIVNNAAVSGSNTDPVPENNSDSEETTVTGPQADLSVTKDDSEDPVQEGGEVTYTLTVWNMGPDTATGVTLTDTRPPRTTFVSANPSQGTCSESGGTVTCTIGTMDIGTFVTVTIVINAPDAEGTIINTATVSSTIFDPDDTDNSDSEETLVTNQQFSLTVNKEGSGSGTVTSGPLGINCGDDCSEVYTVDTVVTLTAIPDSGSTFTGWTGDPDCSDGVITMNANKTCIATFDCLTSFSDVSGEHWAVDYIEGIACAGITTGCGGSNFCPRDSVTRAQMAAFLIRALYGEDFNCSTNPYFADVLNAHWAFLYVQKLFEDTITTGCGPGTYCPTNTVTRAQMATFIVRAIEGEPLDNYCGTTDQFSDVPYTHWACKYIKRLSQLGITTGCGENNYCPNDDVSRAQMAAFLARAFLGM